MHSFALFSSARPPLSGLVFWIEAITLCTVALMTGLHWLLPAAAILVLFGSVITGPLWAGILLSLSLNALGIWLGGSGSEVMPMPVAAPVATLLLGAVLSFLNILASLGTAKSSPVVLALGRMTAFLHFLSVGLMLGSLYLGNGWQKWLGIGWTVLGIILAADCTLRMISRLYTPRRHWASLPLPGVFFFYRWLGSEWQQCFPRPSLRDESFDLKLAEMWMLPTVRRALPALLVTIFLTVWLATCLHEVAAGHQAVRQRLGVWEAVPLQPGLHVSFPWPLGQVESVDTSLLRETVLGFKADPGQPILWERAHYEDEQKSLVGGGDDFLSISVPVFYRIRNAVMYLRSSTDAEALLRSLSQRILLDLTLSLPARDIMTVSRENLRRQLHQELQAALDEKQTGLEIAEVYFRDIHPPVGVAPAFQEVVSAMEDREAFAYEGEAYRRDILPRSQGDAEAILITAQSAAENRLLQVRGQAGRFDAQREAWAQSPQLYQWREGFRVLDETLSGAKKAIFDEALRQEMPTHIDLRKVLNPDFVDTIPPTPQPLVPRPSKSRDAFDLSIDGYLQGDQGEVPSPNFMTADPDNLLKEGEEKPASPPPN